MFVKGYIFPLLLKEPRIKYQTFPCRLLGSFIFLLCQGGVNKM